MAAGQNEAVIFCTYPSPPPYSRPTIDTNVCTSLTGNTQVGLDAMGLALCTNFLPASAVNEQSDQPQTGSPVSSSAIGVHCVAGGINS
jgi:hypothetical protein